jgi:hypothetical protein
MGSREVLSKTFTSMNVLTVAAGTNTPQGGDAGHGLKSLRVAEAVLFSFDGG